MQKIQRDKERIAEQQEIETTIIRLRELEEEIRQREQRERLTAVRVEELEEEIRQREQRERLTAIRVEKLEEEIRKRKKIAKGQQKKENQAKRERERTITRLGELEEEIRQKEQREILSARRIIELEDGIRQRERIVQQQGREIQNSARREQERIAELQERERTINRLTALEEEFRQKEIQTTTRVKELEETVIQKDNELELVKQTLQQLLIEIENWKEQLTFEKKENSANYLNIPILIKEIFKNEKISIFKRYENQPSELLNSFKNIKESKSIISEYLEDFMIKGKLSIGCSGCLLWSDVLDYVSIICQVENLVADKLEKQVKQDYEGFSEWNDDPDTVKLTLIFNVFGLSPYIIEKFGPGVNGTDFDQDIFDLCSTCGIDDLDTILDLGYIQMMLRSNTLPCSIHFETCPVCCCSTPKDLENLMKEHNLDFDFDLLERKNINGPRFIANTRWVKQCGEKIDQKLFRKAFQTVKKLHKIDDY